MHSHATYTDTAPRRSGGFMSRFHTTPRATSTTTTAPRTTRRRWGTSYNTGTSTAGTTTTRRSGWGSRRSGVKANNHVGGVHVGTHGGTTAPVHHHKRHVSIGDKLSGAMLKLKGSLTHRPAVKAAGTRRMHGTDGRGSHRVY